AGIAVAISAASAVRMTPDDDSAREDAVHALASQEEDEDVEDQAAPAPLHATRRTADPGGPQGRGDTSAAAGTSQAAGEQPERQQAEAVAPAPAGRHDAGGLANRAAAAVRPRAGLPADQRRRAPGLLRVRRLQPAERRHLPRPRPR